MHQNSMILSPPIPIVQKFNITNMGLREIGAALPPGFRFCPSDEELVCHYLYRKIANDEVLKESTLMEIDLHTCEPWQLPEFKELRINLPNSLKDLQSIWDFSNRSTVNDVLVCETAKLNSTEWYFFSFRDRKYATGFRTNRATTSGYWKATGKDRTIIDPKSNAIVGMRKTLVFYKNRAPNGIKTGWIMHEFRLESPHLPPKEDWVLCRVFHKAKTENNNEMSPQNVFEAEAPSSYTSPVVEQNPNNLQDISPLNSNFLQLSHANEMMINSKCEEEEYGFLFRMSFEESNLGDGMVSNMEEETRFEDDHGLMFH